MSVMLAKNEKIVKAYEYANVRVKRGLTQSDTYKKLTVTNQRVIHESICEKKGRECAVRSEMPLSEAKYLDTAVAKTAKTALLVWGIILAAIGLIAVILSAAGLLDVLGIGDVILSVMLMLIGGLLILGYFASRRTVLICIVSSEKETHTAMQIAEATTTAVTDKKKNDKVTVVVNVNDEVAKMMVAELGAVLLDAASFTGEDEEEEPTPDVGVSLEEALGETAETAKEPQAEAEETAEV